MVYFFIFAAAGIRILSHLDLIANLPNFAPIAAIALFGGVYLNKKYALGIPLLAMLAADSIIGFYNPTVMLSVYGSFFLIGLIGLWLKKHKNIPHIAAGTLAGSILFYLTTNFAVWAAQSMYPHTWAGLLDCYVMALPFFRNTLLGDFFYVGVMFGCYELVMFYLRRQAAVKASQ